MHFFETNVDHVSEADHMRPMYSLRSKDNPNIPKAKTVAFTGYKSLRCVKEFTEQGIPFDGSFWMFRILEEWDGADVFFDIVRAVFSNSSDGVTWHGSNLAPMTVCGLDPRARNSNSWSVVDESTLNIIINLAHIYGANKYLTISQIIYVEKTEFEDGETV